jgi:hypothetical protein
MAQMTPHGHYFPMEILFYLIGLVIFFVLLYAVIDRAVSSALERHYKNIRWYEKTGEWVGKYEPRPFDAGPINGPRRAAK